MKNIQVQLPVQQVFASYEFSPSADLSGNNFCAQCGAPNKVISQKQVTRIVCSSCEAVTYQNPLPGVSVLIENKGLVLLARRAPGAFASGKWCLPCGFVEYHEDILAAAKREVLEETGLTVELQSIIQVTSNFHAPRLHAVVVVFHARAISGALKAGDDIDKVDWFPITGPYPSLAFEADKEIITRFALTEVAGLPLQEASR